MNCYDLQTPALPPLPNLIVVAAALIDRDGRVLIAKRPADKALAGLWEFPGGKVEQNETPEQALVRELKEELAIDTSESCLAPLVFATHRYPTHHVLVPLYACRVWKGIVAPQENQECRWVQAGELNGLDMLPTAKVMIPVLQDLL